MPEYQFVKKLSAGSYGTVGLILNKDNGNYYALKTISKGHHAYKRQRVLDEVKACQILRHENIVRIHEHLEDNDCDYLIMDFVRGYDLLAFIQANPLPEQMIQRIIQQVYDAITHSHKHGVFHRDLKLENVMVDKEMKVTIIDYGLCHINKTQSEELSEDFCGTIEYAAPELILHIPYRPGLADVWCIGVMAYAMLFGRYPFLNEQRREISCYDDHPPLIIPDNKGSEFSGEVTDFAKHFIACCLTPDPSQRITMEELARHPWISQRVVGVAASC